MTDIDPETRTFIDSQRIARLATVDEFCHPHVVPICFALIEDTLYSAIDEKPKAADYTRLRRLQNIAQNPRVQVLFDVYSDEDWQLLHFVQLHGAARIVTPDDAMHASAVAALRARYRQYKSMSLETRPIIAVDIERVVEWRSA